MESLDPARWNTAALAAAWRAAAPFPHAILDDLVPEEALAALRAAVAAEPHWPDSGELHQYAASVEPPAHVGLAAFRAALDAARGAVAAIAGRPLSRVELRSYLYSAGGYLLPHTDCSDGVDRAVAYAFYLTPDGWCDGGELELYACTLDGAGEIATAAPAATVAHRPNRLVLFDVGPASLHRVREVTRGLRLSLAGWFYK